MYRVTVLNWFDPPTPTGLQKTVKFDTFNLPGKYPIDSIVIDGGIVPQRKSTGVLRGLQIITIGQSHLYV